MIDSPYEEMMGRAKLGLTLDYAYLHHMLEWQEILPTEHEDYDIISKRLRTLKWDALDEDFITIGAWKFPVFFHVEREVPMSEEENFANMLVTTRFPAVPSLVRDRVFKFSNVETPVSLTWLTVPPLKEARNLGYDALLTGTFIAMREKINGYPHVRVQVEGEHYLVGRNWYPTVEAVHQVEVNQLGSIAYIIEPVHTFPFYYGGIQYDPHSPSPYSKKRMQTYGEGAMVFVNYAGVVREYRAKRMPTTEVRIKNRQSVLGYCDRPDGVWEVGKRDKLIPVKERQWKQPREKEVASRDLLSVRMDMLPDLEGSPVAFQMGDDVTWSIKDKDLFIRYCTWIRRRGVKEEKGVMSDGIFFTRVVDVGSDGFLLSAPSLPRVSAPMVPIIVADGNRVLSDYRGGNQVPWISQSQDVRSYLVQQLKLDPGELTRIVYKGSKGYYCECKLASSKKTIPRTQVKFRPDESDDLVIHQRKRGDEIYQTYQRGRDQWYPRYSIDMPKHRDQEEENSPVQKEVPGIRQGTVKGYEYSRIGSEIVSGREQEMMRHCEDKLIGPMGCPVSVIRDYLLDFPDVFNKVCANPRYVIQSGRISRSWADDDD